jgi:hypothetical protein
MVKQLYGFIPMVNKGLLKAGRAMATDVVNDKGKKFPAKYKFALKLVLYYSIK